MAAASIIQYSEGKKAADAQGDIANAQLNQQRTDRAEALRYAEPTPEELKNIQQNIDLNNQDIARKEKLLASSDPAIIEAGQQALKLLRGEESANLNPLRGNITKQEQALRAKLQAQLGSGYENTTAGIQALQAFNEQSSNALANAQQQSLGQLLGVAQDSSARYGMQSNITNTQNLGALLSGLQGRKVSAINGTPITNAGAGFVSDLQNARNTSDAISNLKSDFGQAMGIMSGTGASPFGQKA